MILPKARPDPRTTSGRGLEFDLHFHQNGCRRVCATRGSKGLASSSSLPLSASNGIIHGLRLQLQQLRDDGMAMDIGAYPPMALCKSGSPLPNAKASHDVGGLGEGHRGAFGETFRLILTHHTHAASAMQPALVPMGSSASKKLRSWGRTKTSKSFYDIIESADDSG